MKRCIKCGLLLEDTAIICPGCATLQNKPGPDELPGIARFFAGARPDGEDAPGFSEAQRPRAAVVYLVWSIVLLLFCSFFAVPGLILALQAYSTKDPDLQQSRLKLTKLFCIIGTVLAVLVFSFSVYILVSDPGVLLQSPLSKSAAGAILGGLS